MGQNHLKSGKSSGGLRRHFRSCGAAAIATATASRCFPILRQDFGPLSPWGSFVRYRRQIDHLIYEEIAERRAHPQLYRNDILSLLMCACDEAGAALTDSEL